MIITWKIGGTFEKLKTSCSSYFRPVIFISREAKPCHDIGSLSAFKDLLADPAPVPFMHTIDRVSFAKFVYWFICTKKNFG